MTYQVFLVANFFICILLMKWINISQSSAQFKRLTTTFLVGTPLLSLRSYLKHESSPISKRLLLFRLILSVLFLYLMVKMGHILSGPLEWFELIIISPIIYFLTESLGLFGQLLFSPFTPTPSIHRHPLLSRSLGDFWGRRWNSWVQDWLRDISHQHRNFLKRKIFISFLFSGMFHEAMVNIPYFLFYNESYFGNMTLYFMIQGLGLWLEKKFLTSVSVQFKRVYLWIFILGPSPLFLGKPLLSFFGLHYE